MLNSVQILRAVAAWFVFLCHYDQLVYNFQSESKVISLFGRFGSIGVDMFFIISGFVIYLSSTNKRPHPLEFARSRLIRIIPAYWIFTLASILIFAALPTSQFTEVFDPIFTLKSLLFIPAQNPNGLGLYPALTVGWSLNYEIVFYAIFFIALMLRQALLPFLILAGVLAIQLLLPKLGGDFVFYKRTIIYNFCFGIILAIAYRKRLLDLIPAPIALFAMASAVTFIAIKGSGTHNIIYVGVPCALLFAAFVSLEKYIPNLAALRLLGDWSYSTYLVHVIVIKLSIIALSGANVSDYLLLPMMVAVTILLSFVSFKIVEQPCLRLSKSLSRSHPNEGGSGHTVPTCHPSTKSTRLKSTA